MTEKPLVVQEVIPLQLTPYVLGDSIVNDEVLPLCVPTALKASVNECIMLIVISKQVNTVWFIHRCLEPITRFGDLGRVISKIIKVITEEENFVGSYCGDDSFSLLPLVMQIRDYECDFVIHTPIISYWPHKSRGKEGISTLQILVTESPSPYQDVLSPQH